MKLVINGWGNFSTNTSFDTTCYGAHWGLSYILFGRQLKILYKRVHNRVACSNTDTPRTSVKGGRRCPFSEPALPLRINRSSHWKKWALHLVRMEKSNSTSLLGSTVDFSSVFKISPRVVCIKRIRVKSSELSCRLSEYWRSITLSGKDSEYCTWWCTPESGGVLRSLMEHCHEFKSTTSDVVIHNVAGCVVCWKMPRTIVSLQ